MAGMTAAQWSALMQNTFDRGFAPLNRISERKIAEREYAKRKADALEVFRQQQGIRAEHDMQSAEYQALLGALGAKAKQDYVNSNLKSPKEYMKAALVAAYNDPASGLTADREKLQKLDPEIAISRLAGTDRAIVMQYAKALRENDRIALENWAARNVTASPEQIRALRGTSAPGGVRAGAGAALVGPQGGQQGGQGGPQSGQQTMSLEEYINSLANKQDGTGNPDDLIADATEEERNYMNLIIGGTIAAPYAKKFLQKLPKEKAKRFAAHIWKMRKHGGSPLLRKALAGGPTVATKGRFNALAAPFLIHDGIRAASPWLADAEDNYALTGPNGNTYKAEGFEALPYAAEQIGLGIGEGISALIPKVKPLNTPASEIMAAYRRGEITWEEAQKAYSQGGAALTGPRF